MITGKLQLVPQEIKLTKKGAKFTVFSIGCPKTHQRYKVFCYNDQAERAVKELTSAGQEVMVDPWKETKEDDLVIIQANSFSTRGIKTTRVKKNGGLTSKQLEAGGKRFVTKGGQKLWVDVSECIEVRGRWFEKLEFAMDVLGAKKVSDLLAVEGTRLEKMNTIINLALMDYEAKAKN